MRRFRGKLIKNLFDYQRFKGDSSLTKLIEDTNLRFAQTDMEAIALPDDAVGALAGARGEPTIVLCTLCGAVLRGEEALQAHIADVHPTAWP